MTWDKHCDGKHAEPACDAPDCWCLICCNGKHEAPVCGFKHCYLVSSSDTRTGIKPSNPKDIIGSDKLPLHLWPATATAMGCIGFLEGACKYGRSNFRAVGVRASIYVDAAGRHLAAWFEGEECSPDTGVPHLSAALACIAIIVDAQAHDKLNDDRMHAPIPGYRRLVDHLTSHVKRLKEMFKDKNPKHYTIKDNRV